jgi:hypothetical protein
MKWRLAAICTLLLAGQAEAHEVRPGYLQLRQVDELTFEAELRQPIITLADGRLGGLNLSVEFPEDCFESMPQRYASDNDYLAVISAVTCPDGLGGRAVRVAGLQKTITDVYVSFVSLSGREKSGVLTPGAPEFEPFANAPASRIVHQVAVGVRHLLGGLDHVLFLVGLFLLIPGVRQLFMVGTAFAIAHSATLALSVLGWLRLSPVAVEAAIALSVLILAVEANRRSPDGSVISLQNPHRMALCFGLLHGMGFASVLAEADMPPSQLLYALLFFNVGVEIGQITVFLALLFIAFSMRQMGAGWSRGLQENARFGLGVGAVYFMCLAVAAILV